MKSMVSPSIPLPAGAFWSRGLRRDERIICRSGSLLITLEGVLEDFQLRPGQALAVSRAGRAVVEALDDAVFRVG